MEKISNRRLALKIKNILAKYGNLTPGYSFGFKNKNKIILINKGFADIKRRSKVKNNTRFRIASLTKAFTAMAILMLAEQKKINLNKNLSSYFPDFPKIGSKIKIKNLLNHTSGLPDYERKLAGTVKNQKILPDFYSAYSIMKKFRRLLFNPGTIYRYSESGYVLLALLVEKASGKKYKEFLSENIFTELDLHNTYLADNPLVQIPEKALGYRLQENNFVEHDYHPLNYVVGNEGIYTSAGDLLKWVSAWKTEKLISRLYLEKALAISPLFKDEEELPGFGWFKKKDYPNAFYHTGYWVGFSCIIYFDGSIALTYLCNSKALREEGVMRILNEILKAVYNVTV